MTTDCEDVIDLMSAHDKVAFRLLVSIVNIEAFDESTKTASEYFLTWDILEDVMPFLAYLVIVVDIQWTESDLRRKVEELGLEKQQIVILFNPSQLEVIPKDSAVLGITPRFGSQATYPISLLLDPTRVIMDATMSYVREVGDYFLRGCSSLKEVDLSPLCNVQELGDDFLRGCSSLEKVDLSGLSNVLKVGNNFLRGCSSLEKVDLSGLRNVQKVGDDFWVGPLFLDECSSLTKVILPASPPECLRRALRDLPRPASRCIWRPIRGPLRAVQEGF